MTNGSTEAELRESIELKDPALAAFLAWLVPGLGQLYQGRTAKAVLFFVCIMGTFLYGLYLGSGKEVGWGRVVYASWEKGGDKRLPYLCQLGMGLPAMPALVQASRAGNGNPPLLGGFMAPPKPDPNGPARPQKKTALAGQPTLDDLHRKLDHYFELGTTYTMIAGLLNILAIFDAWAGPVFVEAEKGKEKGKDEEEEPGEVSDGGTNQ